MDKKKKKKGMTRFVVGMMAIFTLVPVAFGLVQGVSTYQNTQAEQPLTETAQPAGRSIMEQDVDDSLTE